MGKPSFAQRRPLAERHLIDEVVRDNQFYNVDRCLDELKAHGISTTRSALARYMKRQRDKSQMLPKGDSPTIVTLVDRVSGEARHLRTDLSIDEIEAMIAPKN